MSIFLDNCYFKGLSKFSPVLLYFILVVIFIIIFAVGVIGAQHHNCPSGPEVQAIVFKYKRKHDGSSVMVKT